MAILFEGEGLKGKAVDVELGDKGGKPVVRWNMLVVDGLHQGKKASYSGKFTPEAIKYTKRDMIALGWKPGANGKYDVSTFVKDVAAADRTVPFTAEIAVWDDPQTGKTKQWTSAKSIGFTAAPLAPLDSDKVADVNSWFAEVGDEVGSNGEGKKKDDLPF